MQLPQDIVISEATSADLAEILALQKLAYLSEAAIHGNYAIQPLVQTLEEVQDELRHGVILKACAASAGNAILGSVRVRRRERDALIGKLMVHPDAQNQGLGARLLAAAEACCPGRRYELFTSSKSAKNLALYTRNGYREFKRTTDSDGLVFIFLEKNAGAEASDLR